MGGYSSFAVRDQFGNIVGYSTQPGQTGSPSQAYADIMQAYNQQRYATIGSSPTVYHPEYSLSLNPGSYASNALGIAQQVYGGGINDRSAGLLNPYLSQTIAKNYGITTPADMIPTTKSGGINYGRSEPTKISTPLTNVAGMLPPKVTPAERITSSGLPPGVSFTGSISKVDLKPLALTPTAASNQTYGNSSANLSMASLSRSNNTQNLSSEISRAMRGLSDQRAYLNPLSTQAQRYRAFGNNAIEDRYWATHGGVNPLGDTVGYTKGKYKPKLHKPASKKAKVCAYTESALLREMGITSAKKQNTKKSKPVKKQEKKGKVFLGI